MGIIIGLRAERKIVILFVHANTKCNSLRQMKMQSIAQNRSVKQH